jgi:hypothetical protein
MKKIPYANAIGCLMYAATTTRLDISFQATHLAQFMSNPGMMHWSAVKRVLRYLKHTATFGLTYHGNTSTTLHGWTDSDWASDPDSRRSITGYSFLLGGAAISWQSQKQQTVALSSTEAEFIAGAATAKEAMWLRHLLKDLGFLSQNGPTTIYCDNQSSIALAKNPSKFHNRSKHIDLRYRYLQEKVHNNDIVLEYKPGYFRYASRYLY